MDVMLNSGYLTTGPVLKADAQLASAGLLSLLMDELACAIMVVTHEGQVVQSNSAARTGLAHSRLLKTSGVVWLLLEPDQATAMQQAFARAAAGVRSLLTLTGDAAPLTLAVIPLAGQTTEPVRVGLVFARASVHEPMMLGFFARSHGLTPTEEQVLAYLCQGDKASDIAAHMKVAVSTIRTHVRNLCTKTRSCGIRELVNRVAVLPPIMTSAGAGPQHPQVH
jgi:DNA-binding CsgD family transcriptional regulator